MYTSFLSYRAPLCASGIPSSVRCTFQQHLKYSSPAHCSSISSVLCKYTGDLYAVRNEMPVFCIGPLPLSHSGCTWTNTHAIIFIVNWHNFNLYCFWASQVHGTQSQLSQISSARKITYVQVERVLYATKVIVQLSSSSCGEGRDGCCIRRYSFNI